MAMIFNDDPTRELREHYKSLQEQADAAESCGDLREYAKFSGQAEEIWEQIERIESQMGHS